MEMKYVIRKKILKVLLMCLKCSYMNLNNYLVIFVVVLSTLGVFKVYVGERLKNVHAF